jgi:hypothetical protein
LITTLFLLETFAKRSFLPNPPEADKFLRLPREMRSPFLWGHTQILLLKIPDVFLRLVVSVQRSRPAELGRETLNPIESFETTSMRVPGCVSLIHFY